MWLLHTSNLVLEFFQGDDLPDYAILSHTWERQGEILFQDFKDKSYSKSSQGWIKIQASAKLAAQQNLEYIWIDTCCIDKSSSAELSEAINSMFRWYERSQVCFAFLSDVVSDQGVVNLQATTNGGPSRWFSRGWTLQELIAPTRVEFYDRDWCCIGTRDSLFTDIHSITGVHEDILCGRSSLGNRSVSRRLDLFSVAERMSWAAKRKTTRGEDSAYSLMGLFDIRMPLLYGEGRTKAFRRLQQEILSLADDPSIFVWCLEEEPPASEPFCGLLAPGPECFGHLADYVPQRSRFVKSQKMGVDRVSERGVHLDVVLGWLDLSDCRRVHCALLVCHMRPLKPHLKPTMPLILLQRTSAADSSHYMRVRPDLIVLSVRGESVVGTSKLIDFVNEQRSLADGSSGDAQSSGGESCPLSPQLLRPIANTTRTNSSWYRTHTVLFPDTSGNKGPDQIGFSYPQSKTIFVPNAVMPEQLASGFLLRTDEFTNVKGQRDSDIQCSIPQWEYTAWGDYGKYELRFNQDAVPSVDTIKRRVICGALLVSMENWLDRVKDFVVLVGLEPVVRDPIGTAGWLVQPWCALKHPDDVDMDDWAGLQERDPDTMTKKPPLNLLSRIHFNCDNIPFIIYEVKLEDGGLYD